MRFDGGIHPKQYKLLGGKPIIIRTLEKIEAINAITSVAIAVHKDYMDYLKLMIRESELIKAEYLVEGGSSRQESVFNVIKSGILEGFDKVIVHDAVRPLASTSLFDRVIDELNDFDVVLPGIKVKDTVKEILENDIRTPDRDKLYSIQTPQGFRPDILAVAHFHAYEQGLAGTDDTSLVEKLMLDTGIHYKIRLIEGEEHNLKITSKFDLEVAELIMGKTN